MKLHKKLLIGVILALAILIVNNGQVGQVNAQPVAVGTTPQTNPFDSNPSAITVVNTTMNSGASMYDGNLATTGYFRLAEEDMDELVPVPGYVELHTFDSPTTTFTIGWVDIRMKYSVTDMFDIPGSCVEYDITYSTDGSNWGVLEPTSSDPFDPVSAAAQVVSWAQMPEPTDGVWSWSDISGLRIRISSWDQDDMEDGVDMYIYDLWACVYEGPLPPSKSTGLSIQPPVIEWLRPRGKYFFIELYAQNVTALQIYQVTINFNTTYLRPFSSGWSYYPFTAEQVADFNDADGYVSLTYSIPSAHPLVNVGVSGNLTLCRIYFRDYSYDTDPAPYSFFTFSVSYFVAPGAVRIVHGEYHGFYGDPPDDIALVGWLPASEYNFSDPITTEWVEQWPNFGDIWHLTSWEDNEDKILSVTDQIDMMMIEPPDPLNKYWWHVEEIWESHVDHPLPYPEYNVYMILRFKEAEPEPEFPLGIGLMMLLALAIPIVYLWRTRKKVGG